MLMNDSNKVSLIKMLKASSQIKLKCHKNK